MIKKFFQTYLSIEIIKRTYASWRADRTLRLGASMAYYGIFALIPISLIMINFSLIFFDQQDVIQVFEGLVLNMFGGNVELSSEYLLKVTEQNSTLQFGAAGIIGVVSQIVSASFIFLAYKDALASIWKEKISHGLKNWVRKYVFAYLLVLLSSMLLFGLLVISTISSLARYIMPGVNTVFDQLADMLFSLTTLLLGSLLLALINRVLIKKKIPWKYLRIGSIFTIIMMIIGTSLLGIYLSNFASASLYGAVGAAFLVLIWIYYQAQIILIGAQYTKVLYETHESITN
jgi:membrane protein